jgi:hypothetical protein
MLLLSRVLRESPPENGKKIISFFTPGQEHIRFGLERVTKNPARLNF